MLNATDRPIPRWTAGISARRPVFFRYARLIAIIRKASSPSRRVITNACSMADPFKLRSSLKNLYRDTRPVKSDICNPLQGAGRGRRPGPDGGIDIVRLD